MNTISALPRFTVVSLLLLAVLWLAGCSHLTAQDPINVALVDVEPLAGGDLELRFALKLRVQNPNDVALPYDGISLALSLNGQTLANGVSNSKGSVPAYGETLLTVPMSISAFSLLKQAWSTAQNPPGERLPYRLTGKLGGGVFGPKRFTDEGALTWPVSAPRAFP
jgi:LEA14-like dessication related protein